MGVPSRTSATTPALDQTFDFQIIPGKVRPFLRRLAEAHPQVLIIALLRGSNDDVAGAITRATGGADFAFDTTGVPTVVADAVKSLRYGGVCGLIGVATGPSVLETAALSRRSVMGIGMGDAIPQKLIPELLDFWAQGRFPFDRLIRTYGLSEINEAEHDSHTGQVIKPVLIP